jgi:hypothetical protein
LLAASDHCPVCGQPYGGTNYVFTDRVTHEKVEVCHDCAYLPQTCSLCGLPVKEGFISLSDGRFLCARDARTAVVTADDAQAAFEDVHHSLAQMFSRFVSFPERNVEEAVVDRVDLQALFKSAGDEMQCPNVWGFTQPKTNGLTLKHEIRILSGLPQGNFKAVCAHELAHTLLFEIVPAQRKRTLGHDATEGFCELVAYLLMDSMHLEEQKSFILQNGYTRGQINLFIEAHNRYGFNDIVEWMKYGADPVLRSDDLDRIRIIEQPPQAARQMPTFMPPARQAAAAPDDLVLKGILWTPGRPLAIINGVSLGSDEQAKVRVGNTNVLIRCLSIGKDSVRIRLVTSGQERELSLPPR